MDTIQSSFHELADTLVRNVNHELRTPLAIAQGYAELLSDGSLGRLEPAQHDAVFVITDHIRELRGLIDRINVLLAAQVGNHVRLLSSLGSVAQRVVDTQREAATQAGLVFDLQIDPATPQVLCDPYQVEQALLCLVENALKFTPAPGTITVSVRLEDDAVACSVSDTGGGMNPEMVQRISQGFQQGDGSTTRRHRGFGLGMAVVQAVTQTHSGHVVIHSEVGRGSQFAMYFPLYSTEVPMSPKPADLITRPRRILAVDDEPGVVRSLGAALRKLPDCQVVTATGGLEALEFFEALPFDLLITDLMMPDMDGLELAHRIHTIYPETAIILITAYGDAALREKANAVAVRHILDKPFEINQVRALALEVLSGVKPGQ